MNTNSRRTTKPVVAVFGAAGHTGRFIVAELLRRGIAPIAIARDPAALAAANFPEHESNTDTNLDTNLDTKIQGTKSCAAGHPSTTRSCSTGRLRELRPSSIAPVPFSRRRMPWRPPHCEPASTISMSPPSRQARAPTLDKYDIAAREAGIAVVPAMGFYGGFADLLVTAALGDWDHADTIDIMIGLDRWHPTRGTRITGEKNTARRVVVAEGQLAPVPLPPAEKHWEFGPPLGRQAVVELPFSEIILIERHVKTAELHTYLSSIALGDVRNPATPAPKAVDATGRSSQRFVVDAVATRDGKSRRITARGRDIYAFSAPLVCEVTARLLEGKFSSVGAQPPGAIFDAQEVLSALTPDHLTFEITAV